MTLDVGPGRNVQPHFDQPVVRYDLRVDIRPTVVGCARKLPFRSNSFSTVYASHVLEHFHGRESVGILREWVRVLQPGGELQVFVPNLEWVQAQLAAGICDEFVLNALYGRQEYETDVHRTGFTPTLLRNLVYKAGNTVQPGVFPLNEIETRTFRNSIMVFARKNA